MEEIRKLGDEERKKKVAGLPFAKEALEFIAESLDSKLALPMGHYLVNDWIIWKLWMLLSNSVEVLQCYDRCIEQVETGVAELGACKFVCEQYTTDHQLCERRVALNLSSELLKSLTRPCFSCFESQVSCKRVAVCVLASDCLENRTNPASARRETCLFWDRRR